MHEHWKNDPHWFAFFLEKLRKVLLIKTNNGLINLSSSVYLTPRYGNKNDFATQFKSYTNWCLIDNCYIDSQLGMSKEIKKARRIDKSENMLSWRRFFLLLGVADVFVPTKKVLYLKKNELEDSLYSSYSNILGNINKDELFEFIDYECNVCQFYMNKTESTKDVGELKNEMTSLYRLIEGNWESSSYSHRNLEQFKFILVNIVVFNKDTNEYIKSK